MAGTPLTLAEAQGKLQTGLEGLSSREAQQRLRRHGPNTLPESTRSVWVQLLQHLWGPIPWMIEAAALLSVLVGDWTDGGIITTLLAVNALVGFWEEHQAGNAIAALRSQLAPLARVKRDGQWSTIAARDLVPGDLLHLRSGDIVPADALLIGSAAIEVDQSMLTGESLPVTKQAEADLYSGSIVRRGETDALVHATGADTSFGMTARLVQEPLSISHFQQAVLKIGDYLIAIALTLVLVILMVGIFRHQSLITILKFSLVLTVASIPVAMPAVLSVTLAVGAERLARKQAIVSRLAAIEELAGIDVLCSDKTGTLTLNQLSTGIPFCFGSCTAGEILEAAALASRWESQDSIDLVILNSAAEQGVRSGAVLEQFTPFDPVRKRTEANLRTAAGERFRVSKGAPQVILALVGDDAALAAQVETASLSFAARGFRSLGVARSDEGGRWVYLGLLPLLDPPRPDSAATIAELQQLGVSVKMLTGDQKAIALEMARQLGLGQNILDSELLIESPPHHSGQLGDAIEQADGFAQVFPQHKYHIVDVLQQRGHIVGMTGDGVNDAPALRKADAGIAVSTATDAARAAADIVLMTPGLSIVAEAIRESRRIFQRMNHYAIYRVAETIRVLLFTMLSILVFDFYPVTAVMIVLLALLNDGAILSIAYDRAGCSPQPERWNMPVVLGVASVLGVLGVSESFGLLYLAQNVMHLSRDSVQTMLYLKLSVAGHLTVFVARTRGPFWQSRPATVLTTAVLSTQVMATLLAVYGVFMVPLGWAWALVVWGYSLLCFVFNDQVKILAYRLFDPRRLLLGLRGSHGPLVGFVDARKGSHPR